MKNKWTLLVLLFFGLIPMESIAQEVDSTVNTNEVVSSDFKQRGVTVGINSARCFYGEIGHYRGDFWEAGGFPYVSTYELCL